jgi:hypothetical protein
VERSSEQFEPAIRRGRVDSLNVHEITEAELQSLERGSPASIFFNLAIAVLSTAVSLTASLSTASISNDRTFTVFVVIAVVGYVCGAAFLLLSYQQRDPVKTTLKTIRSRIPPEGEQASKP